MHKIKLSIFLLVLTTAIVYMACRKADRVVQGSSPGTVSAKFFNSHQPADPTVQKMMEYIKRENEKYEFVDEMIERIGYPYWDKAIVMRKASARRGAADSVDIISIPFVREQENLVNTSLVIRTSVADTTHKFVCDWQYKRRSHGSPSVDSTAEHLALYFMVMDNNVFGQKSFTMTDTTLFSSHPKEDEATLREVELAEHENTTGRTVFNTMLCFDIIVCGTVDYCRRHGGCDYMNCVSDPDKCYASYGCVEFDENGNSGNGGTEGPGGTGGPGPTGSPEGGGGWIPPNNPTGPCGPTSSGKTSVTTPCGPGWVPTGSNPPSANQNIIDSLQGYPCAQGILSQMIGCNAETDKILKDVFGINNKMNLIFKADPTLDSVNNALTHLVHYKPSTGETEIVIGLNVRLITQSAKELIAKTMIHEAVHAYIDYYWAQYTNGQLDSTEFKFMFPIVWKYKNIGQSQHNQIANNYFNTIKNFVRGYNPAISDAVNSALAWNGLTWTKPWSELPAAVRQQMLEIYKTAKYGTGPQMRDLGLHKCD